MRKGARQLNRNKGWIIVASISTDFQAIWAFTFSFQTSLRNEGDFKFGKTIILNLFNSCIRVSYCRHIVVIKINKLPRDCHWLVPYMFPVEWKIAQRNVLTSLLFSTGAWIKLISSWILRTISLSKFELRETFQENKYNLFWKKSEEIKTGKKNIIFLIARKKVKLMISFAHDCERTGCIRWTTA